MLDTGALRCWGQGNFGQLGYGNDDSVGDDETPAEAGDVPGLGVVEQVVAGNVHTCALQGDGAVYCWGNNQHGQLGLGDAALTQTNTPTEPVDLGPGRTARQIASQANHTCAVLDDGTIRCWGQGQNFKLGYQGDGSNIGDDETPGSKPALAFPQEAIAVDTGTEHSCALLADGSVRCWGRADSGQAGNGSSGSPIGSNGYPILASDPVALGGTGRAVAISCGTNYCCARLDDDAVQCWGANNSGKLGYGHIQNVGDAPDNTPAIQGNVAIGTTGTSHLSCGRDHMCTIAADTGAVHCWGEGDGGRLGHGNETDIGDESGRLPADIGPLDIGGRPALHIDAGSQTTCAMFDKGYIRCWGTNPAAQLGRPSDPENPNYGDQPGEVPAKSPVVRYRWE